MDKTLVAADILDEMSNFVFTSKYSRYDEKHQRRETWYEAVKRVEKMHLKKYDYLNQDDQDEIKWAFDQVRDKLVVPSMRSLQFGGRPVEINNLRMYNCSMRHIDSIRSFSEVMYMLLVGAGVGIGISKKFINRLPDLVNKDDRTGSVIAYDIQDSIEGWADAVEALLMSYFRNTTLTGRKIVFDYSKIRAKGTPIKIGGGKAPGHEGLKHSLTKVKKLLDYVIEERGQTRLESINIYDIIMHLADAVVSGGCRRCLPEYYSVQMADKTWKKITDIKVGDNILFDNKEYPIINIYNNGVQELVKINTVDGYHISTPNHKWLVYNKELQKIEWIEAQYLNENYCFLRPKG